MINFARQSLPTQGRQYQVPVVYRHFNLDKTKQRTFSVHNIAFNTFEILVLIGKYCKCSFNRMYIYISESRLYPNKILKECGQLN